MDAAARWLLLPTVAVTFVFGVWVAGGVVTNSFRASMALVALWYAAAGIGVLVVGLRRRRLRAPLWTGYALTAALVGGFLAWSTLRDRVVHERVLVGVPVTQVARAPGRPAPAVVTLARGRFAPASTRRAASPRSSAGATAAGSSRSPASTRRRAPTCACASARTTSTSGR